jgi:hypothetical protein
MFTKSTLVCGDNFHFYRELFDQEHVHLTREGVEFQAGCVTVSIPAAVRTKAMRISGHLPGRTPRTECLIRTDQRRCR